MTEGTAEIWFEEINLRDWEVFVTVLSYVLNTNCILQLTSGM